MRRWYGSSSRACSPFSYRSSSHRGSSRTCADARYGLHIREEGLEHHIVKAGTPTLGGLAILAALSVAFLSLSHYTTNALLVFFVTLGCAAIGFLDDAIKLTHKRSLGLNGRWKLLLLAVIVLVVGFVTERREFATDVYLPVVNRELPLSWAWYALLFFMIAGTASAVNFTDGLDGLAAGPGSSPSSRSRRWP